MKFLCRKNLAVRVSLFLVAALPLMAQQLEFDASAGITQDGVEASISITGKNNKNDTNTAKKPYPVDYRGISLGMQIDDVKKALLAGKHVYVEKPIATRAEEAEEMSRIAQENKLTLMVGHLLLYHPADQ